MIPNNDSHLKTSVTLKMLLDAGILSPGVELYCRVQEVRAILNADGSITVHMNGKEKVWEYLSGAARYVAKISLNGWTYWSIKINGEPRLLDSFREQYLNLNIKSHAD